MKEEKDKLSQSFRDKLGDYSQEVNNTLWINIQAGIRRSRMLRLRYYYMSAASVVVLLGIFAGVLIFSESPVSRISPITPDKTMVVDNSTNTTVTPPSVTTPSGISVIEPKQSQNKELFAVLGKKKRESIIELREKSSKPYIELRPTIIKEPPPSEKVEKKVTTPVKKNLQQTTPIVNESLWNDLEEETLSVSRPKRKLKLSFMGAGAFAENKSSRSKGMLSIDMLDSYSMSDSEGLVPNQSSVPAIMNYRTNYNDYEYSYNVPFSFGVSIRKDLPKGFSLETGVFATMLSTTFLLQGDSDMNIGKNTMWYLGIPIKANWSFFSTDVWSLYLSAGGAIERCISSQYSGEKLYFQDLTVESSSDILAKDFGFQFSVNAAIGLQIKLSDAVGLFFEPGVSYYFNANSPIPTIRTDRPFNVNLQAGVRFSL